MRKSLIIGLGGTGAEICTQLAERIAWQYGSLENVKFVDFLVIDTAQDKIIGTPLKNTNNFLHITISEEQIKAMSANPKAFDNDMGFSSWYNPQILKTKGIVNGTQGVRMLGRMALLSPQNYRTLYDKLDEKVRRLSSLQGPAAQAALGERGQEEGEMTFLSHVHIYVVATACGGTGCGTWLDFGYLLRRIQSSYPGAITTVGILTLPSMSETDSRKKANAYALLTEVNHFSTDDNDFEVQYPGVPHRLAFKGYPYDYPYLVTVDTTRVQRGGLKNASDLNRTIGQYIFGDIFYEEASAIRDGRRDDFGQYVVFPDERGLSQHYLTFGAALVQYPVDRIIRGCSYMLLQQAITEWKSDHTKRVPTDVTTPLGLSAAQLATRLLETPGGTIADRVNRQIDDIQYSSVEDMDEIESRIMAAITPGQQGARINLQAAFPELPPGFLNAVAEANCNRVIVDCKKDLTKHLTEMLFNIGYGPTYLRKVMRDLSRALAGRKQQLLQSQKEIIKPEEMEHARAVLQGIEEDGLQRVPIPFQTTTSQYWFDQWKTSARPYFTALLTRATIDAQDLICKEIAAHAEIFEGRLANFQTYVETMALAFEAEWREQDKVIPINGKLLFEPGSLNTDPVVRGKATITQEYTQRIRERFPQVSPMQAEINVKTEIIANLKTIGFSDEANSNDLRALQGRSFFDNTELAKQPYASLRKDHFELGYTKSSPYFEEIRKTNVTAAFCNKVPENKWQEEIENIFALSEWFLPLNLNTPGFKALSRKFRHWAFYPGAEDPKPGPQLERFSGIVAASQPENTDIHDMRVEPYTMIFLSEYAAFPLRTITGLTDWKAFAMQVMGQNSNRDSSGMNMPGFVEGAEIPTVYTQENVAWVALDDEDKDGRRYSEELFLVGVALNIIGKISGTVEYEFSVPQLAQLALAPLRLGNNLRLIARNLHHSPNGYRNTLASLIHQQRHFGEDDPNIITRLFVDFLSGAYLTTGLKVSIALGQNERDNQEILRSYYWRVFDRFINRLGNEGLLAHFKQRYAPSEGYANMYKVAGTPMISGQTNGPFWPDTGYYCPFDRVFFDQTVPQSCPGCGNVFHNPHQ